MTVNYLVVIVKERNVRFVKEIKQVKGFENGKYILEDVL